MSHAHPPTPATLAAELQPLAPLLEAHGIRLDAARQEALLRFVDLLQRWNRHINLTGERERGALLRRHVLDCLMLEAVPRGPALHEWLDVGAGAGLPGLLIALLHPEYRVTGTDTVAKKVTFQQEAARVLGLANYTALRADVNRLARDPAAQARYDAVVARAFADLAVLLPLARALLRPGGELWAMKGARWAEELERVPAEARAGFAPEPRRFAYRLDAAGTEAVILVFRKH